MRIDSAIKKGREQIDGGTMINHEFVPAWTEMTAAELAWAGAVAAGCKIERGEYADIIRLNGSKTLFMDHSDPDDIVFVISQN